MSGISALPNPHPVACRGCGRPIPDTQEIALTLLMSVRQSLSADTELARDLLGSVANVAANQLQGWCASCKVPLQVVS